MKEHAQTDLLAYISSLNYNRTLRSKRAKSVILTVRCTFFK